MDSAFLPGPTLASAVALLWWWMFGVGMAVWVSVIITMFVVMRVRGGRRESDDLIHPSPSAHGGMERTVGIATFITVLILFGFLTYDFSVGRLLAEHPERALTIDVTGHQWW